LLGQLRGQKIKLGHRGFLVYKKELTVFATRCHAPAFRAALIPVTRFLSSRAELAESMAAGYLC
jgi:hypothetical protein